jgi:hypothetical protein
LGQTAKKWRGRERREPLLKGNSPSDFTVLGQYKQISTNRVISLKDGRGFVFTKPGQYSLTAEFSMDTLSGFSSFAGQAKIPIGSFHTKASFCIEACILEPLQVRSNVPQPSLDAVRVFYTYITAEIVTEYGLEDEMSELLNTAGEDTALSAEDRFWTEDTLTFWALQRKDLEEARARFKNIQTLVKDFTPSETIRIAVLTKELLIAGAEENLGQLRAVFQRAIASSSNGMARRIVAYNYARGLLTCGRPDLALPIATNLVNEYYGLLGIGPADVFLHKLYETAAKIRDLDNNYDEIKRLADSLDLQGSAAHESGSIRPFAKLHAHKFFLISSSFTSAVRVGMDFVDECISDMGDAECARDFIENFLLSVVHEQKMIGALVPVSCQYAVVLAYCGRFDLASKTLQEMAPYIVEGTAQADEYYTQTSLIGHIKTGEVRLPRPKRFLAPSISKMPVQNVTKAGRNDPCPCSSGLKFKKCCGR